MAPKQAYPLTSKGQHVTDYNLSANVSAKDLKRAPATHLQHPDNNWVDGSYKAYLQGGNNFST